MERFPTKHEHASDACLPACGVSGSSPTSIPATIPVARESGERRRHLPREALPLSAVAASRFASPSKTLTKGNHGRRGYGEIHTVCDYVVDLSSFATLHARQWKFASHRDRAKAGNTFSDRRADRVEGLTRCKHGRLVVRIAPNKQETRALLIVTHLQFTTRERRISSFRGID
ncbi:hypothetical protein [Paraburkholderia elongata]|uniref:Uncharacterized protein n=1 Tax=Paraburkholderia elongata TaxID=2675747 RepID=A0A972NJB5_9BURK|nr:hypothetical protein [Paraburkholderia elongata]NPT53902.1 hypothetical protein [Paraburkholderia elongata]